MSSATESSGGTATTNEPSHLLEENSKRVRSQEVSLIWYLLTSVPHPDERQWGALKGQHHKLMICLLERLKIIVRHMRRAFWYIFLTKYVKTRCEIFSLTLATSRNLSLTLRSFIQRGQHVIIAKQLIYHKVLFWSEDFVAVAITAS